MKIKTLFIVGLSLLIQVSTAPIALAESYLLENWNNPGKIITPDG